VASSTSAVSFPPSPAVPTSLARDDVLILSNRNLPRLPTPPGPIGSRLLDLSANRLVSLPADVADYFPRLRSLFLNQNRLRSLPDEIGEMRNRPASTLMYPYLRIFRPLGRVGELGRLLQHADSLTRVLLQAGQSEGAPVEGKLTESLSPPIVRSEEADHAGPLGQQDCGGATRSRTHAGEIILDAQTSP